MHSTKAPLLLCSYGRAVAALLFAVAIASPAHAVECESLAELKLPQTIITIARPVSDGSFTPPGGKPLHDLPRFCRVAGVLQPTADSNIQFEVWLPEEHDWNRKYRGIGNGGFAGEIGYDGLADSIRRKYAASGSDTGHEADGLDATWAYHHPEKIADFGYRAVHLTAVTAKSLIEAFYTAPPQRSYFDSCSDGGREALMEAQRFPQDYDGILAGAPANYWTHLLSGAIAASQAAFLHPDAYISDLKLPAITHAVLAACDAQDGVKDGFLNDPTRCNFDPSVLLCHGQETRACLTEPQVQALKSIYAGARDSAGRQIFPGLMPGSEDGWKVWVTGTAPGQSLMTGFVEGYFRYMVFNNPTWTPMTANLPEAVAAAGKTTANDLNSNQAAITAFVGRGGKLILYHGWNDPAISPLNTIRYFKAVQAALGPRADDSVRLYMVAGMGHCLGGPGPSAFGQLGIATAKGPKYGIYDALETWVEKGTAPKEIIATKYAHDTSGKVEMTRPICPYPEEVRYKGSGDTNDAANFTCAASEP